MYSIQYLAGDVWKAVPSFGWANSKLLLIPVQSLRTKPFSHGLCCYRYRRLQYYLVPRSILMDIKKSRTQMDHFHVRFKIKIQYWLVLMSLLYLTSGSESNWGSRLKWRASSEWNPSRLVQSHHLTQIFLVPLPGLAWLVCSLKKIPRLWLALFELYEWIKANNWNGWWPLV